MIVYFEIRGLNIQAFATQDLSVAETCRLCGLIVIARCVMASKVVR